MGINVLGHVALAVGGRSVALAGLRQQALLLRLLVADGAPVGSWQLRHDVWDGRQKSDAAFRVAVSRLRGVLAAAGAPDVIVRTSDGYRMDRRAVCVDADRFVELVTGARSATDPEQSVAAATEALGMWRGPAFGDLGGEPFLLAEAERLTSLRRDAVELRLAALLALGTGGLAPDLEAAVADSPLRERRTSLLMQALYRDGRQAEALAAFRRLTVAFRDDLGLSPSAELRELERRILQHDPSLAATSRATARPGTIDANADVDADAVHAALGQARSARALAHAGVPGESLRIADAAVSAARRLDAATLAECLVVAAQAFAMAGRACDAIAALDEAVPLARRARADAVLATAAIVRFGFGLAEGDGLLAMLTEPLERLPLDEPQRVDLLCAAMHQMALTGSVAGAARLLAQAEAVVRARPTARAQALVQAGCAVLAGVRGDAPDVVRAAADEALGAADASGDPTLVVAALHSVFRSTLELGDLVGLEAARRRLAAVAMESLFPFAIVRVGLLDVSLALARGELDGLAARITAVEATGRALGVVSVGGTAGAQRGLLALEEGQFETLAQLAAAAADSGAWRAVQAIAEAEAGRVAEAVALARHVLADLGDGDAEVRRDDRLIASALTAEVAVLAGDAELARATAAHLEIGRGRFAVVAHATVTLGPVDRLLGLLALAQGDVDTAVADLRAAVELAAQSPLWLARCQLALATALRTRDAAGDAQEAARSFASARLAATSARTRESAWFQAQFRRAVGSPSTST